MQAGIFLKAKWRHLLMLNYAADPNVLERLVPMGTDLDLFKGQAFVSVVGFQFLNTRVFGWPIPFHVNFEEVNLRFYVRRKVGAEWQRGVVFVRELVPRRAIAFVARAFYGEPYLAVPMASRVEHVGTGLQVEYRWARDGTWEKIKAGTTGEAKPISEGSLEEFITEHYWGYIARGAYCSEYQVEHPRWNVWQVKEPQLQADVKTLYGEEFVESLSVAPASAFVADGSEVVVRKGRKV